MTLKGTPPQGGSGGSDAVAYRKDIRQGRLDMWEAGFNTGGLHLAERLLSEKLPDGFKHKNPEVSLEADDGGIWLRVGTAESYWVGPKGLNAITEALIKNLGLV